MVDVVGVGVKALPRTLSLKQRPVGRVRLKPYGSTRTYHGRQVIRCRNGGKVHLNGPLSVSKARERRVGREVMLMIANHEDEGSSPSPVSNKGLLEFIKKVPDDFAQHGKLLGLDPTD